MERLDLYRVVNEDHDILVHASDPGDALYCANEGWSDIGTDAYVFQVKDESRYDLEIGHMRDLHNK